VPPVDHLVISAATIKLRLTFSKSVHRSVRVKTHLVLVHDKLPMDARVGIIRIQRFTVNLPSMSTVISRAPAEMSLVVLLPPGQRIQICVGTSGQPMTCTTLSCDQ